MFALLPLHLYTDAHGMGNKRRHRSRAASEAGKHQLKHRKHADHVNEQVSSQLAHGNQHESEQQKRQEKHGTAVTILKDHFDEPDDEDSDEDEGEEKSDAMTKAPRHEHDDDSYSGYAPITTSDHHVTDGPEDLSVYQDTSSRPRSYFGHERQKVSTSGIRETRVTSGTATTPSERKGLAYPNASRSTKKSNYLFVLRPGKASGRRSGPTSQTGVIALTNPITSPVSHSSGEKPVRQITNEKESVITSAEARPASTNEKVLKNLKELEDMTTELKENLMKQRLRNMKLVPPAFHYNDAAVQLSTHSPPTYRSFITVPKAAHEGHVRTKETASYQPRQSPPPSLTVQRMNPAFKRMQSSDHVQGYSSNMQSPQESKKKLVTTKSSDSWKLAEASEEQRDDDEDDEYTQSDRPAESLRPLLKPMRKAAFQTSSRNRNNYPPDTQFARTESPRSNTEVTPTQRPVRSFVKIRYQTSGPAEQTTSSDVQRT